MNEKVSFFYLICIAFILVVFFSACDNAKNDFSKSLHIPLIHNIDTNFVPVSLVKRTSFDVQTWSNGILSASQKATIAFQAQGNIVEIPIKNGQFVSVGQVLARIDNIHQQQTLTQAKINYEKSIIEFEDQLLIFGHNITDTAQITPNMLYMAKLRSGYLDACLELARAKHELEVTTVKAPVSGIVTGLEAQTFSPTNMYKNLCVLQNCQIIRIKFNLLESDAGLVHLGMNVKVYPIALQGKEFVGKVCEIEPIIDNYGSLHIVAQIENHEGQLIDGMNAKIVLENSKINQLVIPKTAVLTRQGRQVVFTVENGLAIWNYVTVGYENLNEYTITDGLTEGQLIITGNNLTIGHQAPVSIQK